MSDIFYSIHAFFDDIGKTWNELLSPSFRKIAFSLFLILSFIVVFFTFQYPFHNTAKQNETLMFLNYLLVACSVVPFCYQFVFSLLGRAVYDMADALMGMVYLMLFGSLLFALGAYSPFGISSYYLVTYIFCFLGLLLMSLISLVALVGAVISLYGLFVDGSRASAIPVFLALSTLFLPALWVGHAEYKLHTTITAAEASQYRPIVTQYMEQLDAEYKKQHPSGLPTKKYFELYAKKLRELVMAGREQQEKDRKALKEKYRADKHDDSLSHYVSPEAKREIARRKRDKWKRWLLW